MYLTNYEIYSSEVVPKFTKDQRLKVTRRCGCGSEFIKTFNLFK